MLKRLLRKLEGYEFTHSEVQGLHPHISYGIKFVEYSSGKHWYTLRGGTAESAIAAIEELKVQEEKRRQQERRAPKHAEFQDFDPQDLAKVMPLLDPRETAIVEMRVTYGMTYQQIAKELDRTTSRCQQIHKRALGKLRGGLDRLHWQGRDQLRIKQAGDLRTSNHGVSK